MLHDLVVVIYLCNLTKLSYIGMPNVCSKYLQNYVLMIQVIVA